MICKHLTHLVLLSFCVAFITACPTERFRHETYKCNSGTFDISEIILNDTSVGDKATIIGYNGEEKAEIQSSSRTSITMMLDDMKITVKRDTGAVTIKRGNRIAVLSCSKTVFKM